MSRKKKLIRRQFRETSLERDGHACVTCGISEREAGELDVHHITDRNLMPHGGYVKENGISLCPECHLLAERWHQSEGSEWAEGYHPDELYQRIGSSHDKALRASQRLAP